MTDAEAHERALAIVAAAADAKAQDLLLLEVGAVTLLADYFILASGTSDRHVRSICERIVRTLREQGHRVLHQEGEQQARWVLLDYGDVVVHVFDEETREKYHLEELWADAPRVPITVAA